MDNELKKILEAATPSDEPIIEGDIKEKEVAKKEPQKEDNEKPAEDKKQEKKKHVRLKNRTKENDIKYQGPLSYRYIRMIAWFFMAVAQLAIVFKFAQTIDSSGATYLNGPTRFINTISTMPLALFLLANFGIILRNRKNFKYLFIFYGGIMLALYIVANIIVLHYVYGILRALNPDTSFQDVALVTGSFLGSVGTTGYIFNLFVDLFICVLTVFFLFYNPKTKVFAGKRIALFRCLIVIPLLYEIASIILKHHALLGNIVIPSYFFFLLTSKPPLTFLAFFIITITMKLKEVNFLKKHDHNQELLQDHYSTNAHSFRTSITIAIVFLVISIVDVLVFLGYGFYEFFKLGADSEDTLYVALGMASNIGLGGSTSLILIVPFVLLYSYTRVHKNKKIDSFIPFLGIAFMIFVLIEGMFLTLRFTLPKFIEGFKELEELEGEDGDFSLETIRLFSSIFFK